MDSLEQQIRDRLESAYLFAFGDAPEPETGTVIADPMKMQVYESALREEMKNAILLLAREIDALKSR